MGSEPRRNLFYDNERAYFQNIKGKFDGLLWTDLCHWHEAIYYAKGNPYHDSSKNIPINHEDALIDSIKWLSSFDFNEPDTVFFYADHSHRVEPYLDPPGYITWAYWKDNRIDTPILRPVISSYDIYRLVLSVLNITIPAVNIRGELPTLPYDINRIYHTEDGKANAEIKDRATVFTQTQLVDNTRVSVSHVAEGASCPVGKYLKIGYHSYDMYELGNNIMSRIICNDGISPRYKENLDGVVIDNIYLHVGETLGWKI